MSEPVISERYQMEIDMSTHRLKRRYEHALRARERAQHRLSVAIQKSNKSSRLAELRRQLEMREYELMEIVKLMQPSNRSRVPWRPVPTTHGQPV